MSTQSNADTALQDGVSPEPNDNPRSITYQPLNAADKVEIADCHMAELDNMACGSNNDDIWEDDATEQVWTMVHQSVGFKSYKDEDRCNFPDEATRSLDFFHLFFTPEYLSEVVKATNEHAAELVAATDKKKDRLLQWEELTVAEFEIFLGTLFLMGTVKMETISEYWDTDPDWIDFYPRHFIAKKRFLHIFKALRFGQDNVNSLIDYFNKRMSDIFMPGENLTVDSHILAYYHNKFKLHRLATASGIILKIVKHKIANEGEDEQLIRNEIVKELLQDYLNTGRHVYMDKYYNNVNLATWLVENKTNVTGTLKLKKNSEPETVLAAKLKEGHSIYRYSNLGVCVCKWRDEGDILALSSVHSHSRKTLPRKRKGNISLGDPDMSKKYHEIMMQMDSYDLLMDYYVLGMKPMARYKKTGIHIYQIMLLNAFLLYKLKKNKPKLNYHKFRNNVFKSYLPMHLIPLNQADNDNFVEAA